jgi:hypothetical protein
MGMAQRLLYVVVGVHIPAVILFGRSWARAISMHFSCMKTVWTPVDRAGPAVILYDHRWARVILSTFQLFFHLS